MKFETLDFFFPFLVFFYGVVMAFVQEYIPALGATLRGHRNLAWVCLFVGGLWSLQNLWIGTY